MFAVISPVELSLACLITILASFVKGAVGFAMPMIMISGLATIVTGDLALALLIIPTVLTNLVQAFEDGPRSALAAAHKHRRYLVILLVLIVLSAQLVAVLPQPVMFLALGLPITGFAIWQLMGRKVVVATHRRKAVELGMAVLSGFTGGLSGVWGPPTVVYLTMIDAPKAESVRVQGVLYLCGACTLTLAHLQSGVLNAQTLPLSGLMILPAVLGLWLGMRQRGKLDEARFRHWTLIVLIVAGANLIRKGLVGL